jgi:hypothetical protein
MNPLFMALVAGISVLLLWIFIDRVVNPFWAHTSRSF